VRGRTPASLPDNATLSPVLAGFGVSEIDRLLTGGLAVRAGGHAVGERDDETRVAAGASAPPNAIDATATDGTSRTSKRRRCILRVHGPRFLRRLTLSDAPSCGGGRESRGRRGVERRPARPTVTPEAEFPNAARLRSSSRGRYVRDPGEHPEHSGEHERQRKTRLQEERAR
jgi:hypothetical protein